jgi:hypothetical protein
MVRCGGFRARPSARLIHFGAIADSYLHWRRRGGRQSAPPRAWVRRTFEKDGEPYASPKARATWGCYILDKYEIGLLDAATLAGVDDARTLLPRVIEGALRYLPDHPFDRVGVKQPAYDEPYVLPENLFNTYALTGDERYFDLAKLYLFDHGFSTRWQTVKMCFRGSMATAT